MKHLCKILLSIIFLLLLGGTGHIMALTFSGNSQFSSGRWVKISVPQSGIYEVSYDRLRQLGFQQPENVKVWGDGGVMYPEDFVDTEGINRLIPDTMQQISVWHNGNKLYFYGRGPENLYWRNETMFGQPGYYVNGGLNIYSTSGVYFLSDRGTDMLVKPTEGGSSAGNAVNYGYSAFIHEVDYTQGVSHSGQRFWGENFLSLSARTQSFPYSTPMPIADAKAMLGINFITQSISASTLKMEIDGKEIGMTTIDGVGGDSYTMQKYSNKGYFDINAPQDAGNITISWTPANESNAQAHLDYFLLSYPRQIKFAQGESQFGINSAGAKAVIMPENSDAVCWDVTDVSSPTVPIIKANAAFLTDGCRELRFFRTSQSQPTPEIIGSIPNRNIRAELLATNPELVILTTEEFRTRARQLADFHESTDKIATAVVTIEEAYNEFSSGRPDPMAYRSLLRMLANASGSRLRAVMLYGPQLSNVRMTYVENPREAIIVYQNASGDHVQDCIGFTDIYGIFNDRMPAKYIATAQMDIAVGLVPVISDAEAERYYNKVVRYTLDSSRAYWMERMLFAADDADGNGHAKKVDDLSRSMSNATDSAVVFEKAFMSEYGWPAIKKPFFNAFNQGISYSMYIGHGSPVQIGKKAAYLSSSDIGNFKNNHLSFMTFASCETTLSEVGERGVSEHMVLSSDDGLVGMFGTTRTAFSLDNNVVMDEMCDLMLRLTDAKTGQPVEVGELVRRSKNALTGTKGKYKFQLISDPVLRLYVPTMKVAMTTSPTSVTPGETLTLEGRLTNPDGTTASNFNGEIVIKWYQPAFTVKSDSKVAHDPYNGFNINYDSEVAAVQSYIVTNGRFKITAEVPELLREYAGQPVRFTCVAFDAEQRIGGSYSSHALVDANAYTQPQKDTEAPVVEVMTIEGAATGVLLPEDVTLVIEATDNTGLRMDEKAFDGPLELRIDGQIQPFGVSSYIRMENGARKLVLRYPLTKLSAGQHSAEIKVMDFAGNTGSREYTFEVGSSGSTEAPLLTESACRTTATFTLEENLRQMALSPVLVVTDAMGREVRTTEWKDGSTHQWNLTDAKGNRVTPGLYKAYVRYVDANGRSAVTRGVYVPVLKP